eukprot:9477436-Pyramimonas_sp.AAC.2
MRLLEPLPSIRDEVLLCDTIVKRRVGHVRWGRVVAPKATRHCAWSQNRLLMQMWLMGPK